MAPEVPQVARDVIDWFRGKRHSNVTHLGDTVIHGRDRFSSSDFGGKGISFRVPPGVGYASPIKKDTTGSMVPDISGETSTEEGISAGVPPGVGYTSPIKKEVTGRVVSDISGKSPTEGEISFRVSQSLGYTSRRRRETAGRMVPDISGEYPMEEGISTGAVSGIDALSSVGEEGATGQRIPADHDESAIGERPDDRVSLGIAGEYPVDREGAAVQKVPDIGYKSPVGNMAADQVLPGIVGGSLMEEKGAAEQIISDIDSGISPKGEMAPDQVSPDRSDVSFIEKEAPGVVGPEITVKMTEVTRDREVYKEGDMNNMHYVARDDNESNLVQRLHPGCNVMIPADYEAAIEEIKTCPLDCPYRALEFAELDQRTLRSRRK